MLWKTGLGAMTISSKICENFIYSLPWSEESGTTFIIQKYPKHERAQIKIEDNDNKKLGTQNRAENKLRWATSLRTLEPEFHCPEHIWSQCSLIQGRASDLCLTPDLACLPSSLSYWPLCNIILFLFYLEGREEHQTRQTIAA